MPRNKSHKLLQATILVGFVALLSNLGLNIWEKYTLQAELGQMKTSLHFLKDILVNIGTAYDKLHNDLKELADVAQKKRSLLSNMQTELEKRKCFSKYTLDRRKLHDMEVGAMVEAKNAAHNYPPKADKITEKHFENRETRNKGVHAKRNHINDMTTMTRYPPKSTGVGVTNEDRKSHIRFNNPAVFKQRVCTHDHFCRHDPFDYYNNYGDGF